MLYNLKPNRRVGMGSRGQIDAFIHLFPICRLIMPNVKAQSK